MLWSGVTLVQEMFARDGLTKKVVILMYIPKSLVYQLTLISQPTRLDGSDSLKQ